MLLPWESPETGVKFQGQATSFVGMQFRAKDRLTVDDALSLMYSMLYQEDPDKVIDFAAQLSTGDAVKRPDYWFYLATAFGQKLRHFERGSAEWQSARDNALDSARRAVAIDPLYRQRLWTISEPDGFDDDLAPLRDDADFRALVGR